MIDKLLYDSLLKFYSEKYNKNKIIEILIDNKDKLSLRSIDWFVTNYSKKNNIFYSIYYNKNGNYFTLGETNEYRKNINVYLSYKSQLKAYSKKKFDPFCRRDRIEFHLDDILIETTIGQLNFFKWAIENNIIDYIKQNKKHIENDMNNSIKISKNVHNKTEGRKKRQELSLSATRGLSRTNLAVRLEFN